MIPIFAYGSNMSTARIRDRAASATPVAVGYVTRRLLVFHKRGADGSAKADAQFTGCRADRIWGVVFRLSYADKLVLNEFEPGYSEERVAVIGDETIILASAYIAPAAAIDKTLQPLDSYRQHILDGAIEHQLPEEYIDQLRRSCR